MIASNQLVPFPSGNALIPREGPKSIPVALDFSAQGAYDVDLQIQMATAKIQLIQTVFVDNRSGTTPLTISVNQSREVLSIPPRSQGYLPILAPSPFRALISCADTSNSNALVYFCNFPVPAAVWSAVNSGIGNFDANGNLLVSDPAIAAASDGNALNVNPNVTGNGDILYSKFGAAVLATGTVATATTSVTLVAADPDFGFFVSSVEIYLTGDAEIAAPGNLTISLVEDDGVTPVTLAQWIVTFDGTAISSAFTTVIARDYNLISTGYDHDLNLVLSEGLTAGTLVYNIGLGQTVQSV